MIDLVKRSIAALSWRVLGTMAMALTFVLVARSLTLEELGIYSLMTSLVVGGRFVGPLGLDQLLLRNGSRSELSRNDRSKLFGSYLSSFLLVGTPIYATIFLTMAICFEEHSVSILIGLLILLTMATSGITAVSLRIEEKNFFAFFPDAFLSPVIALFGSFIFLLFNRTDNESFLSAVLFGNIACLAIQICADQTVFRPCFHFSPIKHFRQSIPLWLTQLASFLQQRSVLYVAALAAGVAAVGLVDAAMRLALVGTMSTWALGAIFTPKVLERLQSGDEVQAQKLVDAASFLALAPAAAMTLLVTVTGPGMLELIFGSGFENAYLPAILILMGTSINAAGSFASICLMHMNRHHVVLAMTILAILAGTLVGYFLGLAHGASGVALGALISAAVRDIGLSFLLPKHLSLTAGALSIGGWRRTARTLYEHFKRRQP